MAVLIEGISIVVKAVRIASAFPSRDAFLNWVPNRTMCSDNELIRIGFMSPVDVASCVSDLEKRGLKYLVDRVSQDIAVIDQIKGLCCACDWAEVYKVSLDNDKTRVITAAQLVGSSTAHLALPVDWKFECSLTSNHRFIPTSGIEKSFAKVDDVRSGVRTFTDHDGKQWHMGKTSSPK